MNNNDSKQFKYNCKKDLLSVILLSYYSENYLFEAIDSILEQKYKAIELIISDDGTKDFDEEKINSYIKMNRGNNLRNYKIIHRKDNIGTVKNINNALAISSGEYIKLLGGDDTYPTSDVCTHQVEIIKEEKTLAVIGKVSQCIMVS